MNKEPLFSVLIANYNNGKYLMDAIESVRNQSYSNWEIILVDDCSTDNSIGLYKKLIKDDRIHIYYNDQNMGCGYTKRRCADLANGEICGFLDPDDMILENALELMVNVHLKHQNVSIVYSKTYFCDTDYNIIDKANLPNFSSGKTFFDYREYGSMALATYKNELYKKTVGINPELKAGVDQDLYFKIEEVGDIYPLDEFTYKYVIEGHDNSIATNFDSYARLWFWNLIARRDACIRRNIPQSILINDLQRILDNYAKELLVKNKEQVLDMIINDRCMKALYEQEMLIRSSKAYKIGSLIIKPIKTIKKLLHL